jgi:hypothetical protein
MSCLYIENDSRFQDREIPQKSFGIALRKIT